MYPKLEIDLFKIRKNVTTLKKICDSYNIEIAAVTKVFCGEYEIVKVLKDSGINLFADSRLENIKKYNNLKVKKMLLRLPMKSQAKEVVKISDISLNSEIETIKALSDEALKIGVKHKIILMIDLGDLREGILNFDEVFSSIEIINNLKGIELIGLGTNLTCYGGVIPRNENLSKLSYLRNKIKEKYNISLQILSGGNSSSLHLLLDKSIPNEINQLRLGEAIILGRETAFGNSIEGTYDDCFKLKVEIIEIKDKPSIPIGEIGMDAFGNVPRFIDRGIRTRALCAIGKQDVDINDIIPIDNNIEIIGGSSDHLILDITESNKSYKIGDIIEFKLTYGGILKTMTSPYVKKEFLS